MPLTKVGGSYLNDNEVRAAMKKSKGTIITIIVVVLIAVLFYAASIVKYG